MIPAKTNSEKINALIPPNFKIILQIKEKEYKNYSFYDS